LTSKESEELEDLQNELGLNSDHSCSGVNLTNVFQLNLPAFDVKKGYYENHCQTSGRLLSLNHLHLSNVNVYENYIDVDNKIIRENIIKQ
jgi:hypothetical protein